MQATVTEMFYGCADGDIYPRPFHPGETIDGSLAEAMVSEGKAKWAKPEKKPAPQAKAKTTRRDKSRGPAPRNKSTS